MSNKVVCFGEMLWDCFPDHEIPGGAPMNVALHLKQLGLDSKMISRVGNDERGRKLIEFVKGYDLQTTLIQEDADHQTGIVTVDGRDPENIKYSIVSPVAWDYISLDEGNLQAVSEADALVFGSLGVRNHVSWETLLQLLKKAKLRIFDVNLRSPFYDFDQIELALGYSEILKINEDELLIMSDYFGVSDKLEEFAEYICTHFPIKLLCITLGSKGALLYDGNEYFKHSGYAVKVQDTIGSGDAFLSGLIFQYLKGNTPDGILDFACALGAFVASQKGGTPKYKIDDIFKGLKRNP